MLLASNQELSLESANETLARFGVLDLRTPRLEQLRQAVRHPSSVWVTTEETDKKLIIEAVDELIGPLAKPILVDVDTDAKKTAAAFLDSLGVKWLSFEFLRRLRAGKCYDPTSCWDMGRSRPEQQKIIAEAIDVLIGKQSKIKPKKCKPPPDYTFLDTVGCAPELRTIIINRFPHRPYCTDSLESGLSIRRRDVAIQKSYIQHNPSGWKSVIVVDVDRSVTDTEWSAAGLPAPTWIAFNPVNGHAHFAWLLTNPVWSGGANQRPAKYVEAVTEAFRRALAGDEGFANLITKNPASLQHQTVSPSNYKTYSLKELADTVNIKGIRKPKRNPNAMAGVGRNCTLFDELRYLAYSVVSDYSRSDDFSNDLETKILILNQNLAEPLAYSEVRGIARSVAKGVWKHMRCSVNSATFTERQSMRGKRSGEVRRAKTEQDRLFARSLHADGKTIREIADKLRMGKSTIARWVK